MQTKLAATALTTAFALTALPSAAEACGGFFCSSAAPVDQSGEMILFDIEGREVTMHVQIAYDGPSENFGWILPIPADHPDEPVAVGTESVFQALLRTTQPIVRLNQRTEGQCLPEPWECYAMMEMDDADGGGPPAPNAGGGDPGEPEVEVLLQMQVGPFDVAVLNANGVEVLMEWLGDNGYDIPDETGEYLDPYLGDSHFVAMKLTKGAEAGDIQPVILKFRADTPMIPLRLTAVASTDDMPLFAWFLGEGRAIPHNWPHVELNMARIPWQQCNFWPGCQMQWQELVGEAADEAGGRAFATAFHGRSQIVANQLPNPSRFDIEALKRQEMPWDFVQQALRQGFPRDTKMQNLLRRFIPKPASLDEEGVDDRQFYNCLRCYERQIRESGFEFDALGFAEALENQIVGPLTEIYERFQQRPDLTLLYTELSPEEMTDDPIFAVNQDLDDVPQQRNVTLITECQADVLRANAPFRIEYRGDTLLHAGTPIQDNRGAYVPDDGLPAARRIERMDVEGPPEVVTDNGPGIDERIAATAAAALEGRPGPTTTDPAEVECSSVCCMDGDPCGWQWNRQCDCDGAMAWDNRAGECGEVVCNPGAQVQCVCADGGRGAQTCDLDGSRYGACDCQGAGQPNQERICQPQEAVVCMCPDGDVGIQRCADDARSWGACDCAEVADGEAQTPDNGLPGDRGAEQSCVAGRSMACTCKDGDIGAMQCNDDARFGVCSCEPIPGGGGGGGLGGQGDKPSESDNASRDQGVGCACSTPGAKGAGSGSAGLFGLGLLGLMALRRRS
jgi:MYXO-CTERM domain-containing protein